VGAILLRLVALALIAALALPAAAHDRSAAQVRAYRALHPCPTTQRNVGPCPGYVVDHKKPLCLGGADRPRNMQWQAVAAAKRKDVRERRACALKLRRRANL
jgi:hypothetical protein